MDNSKALDIINEVKKSVMGKDYVIKRVLEVILAGGHVLMEDIPGVGKTTLALSFARAMDLTEKRMQFTTDVLPSDVIGFSMYNSVTREFEYREGSIMCNLFLADEINRTSSKTQSALLEAMEEGQITVDGITRKLPEPFFVIATQNPVGSAGTQLLPESQLDRFMVRLSMGYPDINSELKVIKDRQGENPLNSIRQCVTKHEIIEMQKEVDEVHVDDAVYLYMIKLVDKSRKSPMIELGISPRGTLAFAAMSRAEAYMEGRNYVVPEDVQNVFSDIARHRLILSPKARVSSIDVDTVIAGILKDVPVPKAKR